MEELESIGYKRLKQTYFDFDWEQPNALFVFMNELGVIFASIETEKNGIKND